MTRSIRAMTKEEQQAYAHGSNDFRGGLVADPARHNIRSQEGRDAYVNGYQMAIGQAERTHA